MSRWLAIGIGLMSVTAGAIGVALLFTPTRPTAVAPARATPGPVHRSTDEPVGAGSPPSVTMRWDDELVARLVDHRWKPGAARAVVAFHRDWLDALRSHDRHNYEATALQLAELKDADAVAVSEALARRPELAGPLTAADEPRDLAEVLDDDGDVLASLFAANADREDARLLAAVLTGDRGEDGRRIAHLTRKGLVGVEAVFAIGYDTPGAVRPAHEAAYLNWVREAFKRALEGEDDEPVDLFVFLLAEGRTICTSRLTDERFRQKLSTRWSVIRDLVRATRDDQRRRIEREGRKPEPDELSGFIDLIALPGVWEFADHPDAGRLFARRGVLAVDALHAFAANPARRERVADLLRDAQWDNAADWLLAYLLADPRSRGWVALEPFLDDAAVNAGLIARIGRDVHGRPEDKRLKRLSELTDALTANGEAGLRAVLVPDGPGLVQYLPGYAVYRLYDKYDRGEEIENTDLLLAGVDAVSLAPGAGAVITLGKTGGKMVAKEGARAATKQTVARIVAARVGKEAATSAAEAGARAGFWLAARAAYHRVGAVVQKAVAEFARTGRITIRYGQLDITRAVQFAYTRSGLGRQTFQRLTGLDARLFMRGDARVALHVYHVVTPAPLLAKLEEFLEKWADGTDDNPPRSSPQDDGFRRRALGVLVLAARADLPPRTKSNP